MSSKKLLTVFGATGNQGLSTIRTVLSTPSLSIRYSLRGITRNASSPTARELSSQGVEIIEADLDKPETLPAALQNSNFIFLMTNTQYGGNTSEIEWRQAKSVLDEALKAGVEYVIFSGLNSPKEITGGKLTKIDCFEVGYKIEQYIRSLPVKCAIYSPGSFMQNFLTFWVPSKETNEKGEEVFVWRSIMNPETELPLIDIRDSGCWTGAMLEDPDKFNGKTVFASSGCVSVREITETASRLTGKRFVHEKVADEVMKGYLPEGAREMLWEMQVFFREYGYFGPEQTRFVEEGLEGVLGKPKSWEEFVKEGSFKLE